MSRMVRIFLVLLVLASSTTIAQPDLAYFLPDNISYNSAIPTPQSIIGHHVGEWHVTHDKLVEYMRAIDQASDRVSMEITGYTHERRPLILLTITSPQNQSQIETLRKQHLQLSDPAQSASLDMQTMPSVFYLGCSIHGNEPSGSNAALLIAYYLAAAEGKEIENTLRNTIVLLDPSLNPDGMQRFSSWVNSRKSRSANADANDMEHNEAWPTGRTNHYWFDLNRDWIVAQQPESQARVKKFHEWKPNLLTDHHEMMTQYTFFFQPGVPSRNHPLTPQKNYELTAKIGTYHAKALDSIGSLYYTQEGFDDFYHGKGSSFPDVQGGIGILFEQASSRGHAQESPNGVLRFPFTIRNQFTTALSSLKAITEMRIELLNYQRQFYRDAQADAAKDPVKALVFSSNDKARLFHLAEIFIRHDIKLYKLASRQVVNGKTFEVEGSFAIPLQQQQYRLIKSVTEKRTTFRDSIFYDISTWNLALTTGVEYEEVKSTPALGTIITKAQFPSGRLIGKGDYALVFETDGYYAPRAINRLLQNNIRCKVSSEVFYHSSGKKFSYGSILIPLHDQQTPAEIIKYLTTQILNEDGIDIYAFESGLDYKGASLGSASFQVLHKPEIAILVDGNVASLSAGEIWHLLDVRFNIPATLMPVSVFNSAQLNRYNTIIFPAGTYSITDQAKEKLKSWINNGGVVIGFENALNWLTGCGIGKFDMKKNEESGNDPAIPTQPYLNIDNVKGAQETSGAIFEVALDLTHPLSYGYNLPRLSVFKGNNIFMEKSKNAFGNPITYTMNPLLSGYISKENLTKARGAAYAGVTPIGKGRVIGFSESVAFRAFCFSTNKMLTNAIFYGFLINENASR